MKRFLKCFIISTVALLLSLFLSLLLDFSLSNTWQGMVALIPIFAPFYWLAWKFSGEYKEKDILISIFIRFMIIVSVIVYVPVSIKVLFFGA